MTPGRPVVPQPPSRIAVSAEELPARDRFAVWREVVCSNFYLVTPENDGRPEEMVGRLTAQAVTDLGYFHTEGSHTPTIERTAANAVQDARDGFWVLRKTGAHRSRLHIGGRQHLLRPGDVLIASDANRFRFENEEGCYGHQAFTLPRRLMSTLMRDPDRLEETLYLDGGSGEGALLSSYLGALADQLPKLSEADVTPLFENIGRVVAITTGVSADAEEVRRAPDDILRARIRSYVESNLHDPLLSPPRVARALGISTRKLHGLFAGRSTTFSQHLLQRRLAAAAERLGDPGWSHATIAEIAYGLGFNSLATFYRTYGDTFGAAPGEARPR